MRQRLRPAFDSLRLSALAMAAAIVVAAVCQATASDRPPLWRKQASLRLEAAVAVELAVSMAAYRQWLVETGRREHAAFPSATRWLWLTAEGASIQRVATNTFRITEKNCLEGFCSSVDCIVGSWPQLFCHDGQERRISAPDLQTVILDDRIFKRELVAGAPPPDEPEPSEPDQNTAR